MLLQSIVPCPQINPEELLEDELVEPDDELEEDEVVVLEVHVLFVQTKPNEQLAVVQQLPLIQALLHKIDPLLHTQLLLVQT